MQQGSVMRCVRRVLRVGVTGLVVFVAACTSTGTDGQYQPVRAQHGKDVMWIPTPDTLVTKMLEMAQLSSSDLLYDLGAGDGKIPIEAARRYGATAVGIEYNPEMAQFARENVKNAGVQSKVTIVTGDIFEENFSHADVLTLYLLESINVKLKPQILAMRPGTRVVSNSFRMGAWQPDQAVTVDNGWSAYLWVVPSQIQGTWKVSGGAMPAGELGLKQIFQHFEGTLRTGEGKVIPVQGHLDGPRVFLESTDTAKTVARQRFLVKGDQWIDAETGLEIARKTN